MSWEQSRIVITGVGLVTPLGLSAPDNVARLRRGACGITAVTGPEKQNYPCAGIAPAPPFEISESAMRFPKNMRFLNPAVRCALRAALEAFAASGLTGGRFDPDRAGIYTGSGQTESEYSDFFQALTLAWEGGREPDFKFVGGRPSHLVDRYGTVRTLSNLGLAILSTELEMRGANGNFVQSDTASAQALYAACCDLDERRCDVALAGGFDSLLKPGAVLAYLRAGLLSPDAAVRPFDAGRNGLVPGEGAAFFILERREDAEARGALVWGEIVGAATAADPDDDLDPCWNAERLRGLLAEVLGEALPGFVIARGIATRKGDRRESQTLAGVLGRDVPVTALKGRTGYLGAATAAVELALGLLCARQGFLPPVGGCRTPDPCCHVDLVTGSERPLADTAQPGLFLSGSWGGEVAAIAARACR